MQKAVIKALWVAEVKPDFVSRSIEFCLKRIAPKYFKRSYSHNALIFENEVWHGTFSDVKKYDGFCNEPIERALKGSKVVFCAEIETVFTIEELKGYLNGRKGTPYSMSQNFGAVMPMLFKIPLLNKFFKNGRLKVNCSEVLAELCQGGVKIGSIKKLKFGDPDFCKPTDTFRVIKPDECSHNYITNSKEELK